MVYLPSLHSMLKIRFQIGRSIQRLVTGNLASIYQQYMSDNAFYILYLMGGDDENTIIGKSLRNKLTKLALPRNVKTIGRLVHQKHFGMGSHGKAHKDFLTLTKRKPVKAHVHRHAKRIQIGLHVS